MVGEYRNWDTPVETCFDKDLICISVDKLPQADLDEDDGTPQWLKHADKPGCMLAMVTSRARRDVFYDKHGNISSSQVGFCKLVIDHKR